MTHKAVIAVGGRRSSALAQLPATASHPPVPCKADLGKCTALTTTALVAAAAISAVPGKSLALLASYANLLLIHLAASADISQQQSGCCEIMLLL